MYKKPRSGGVFCYLLAPILIALFIPGDAMPELPEVETSRRG